MIETRSGQNERDQSRFAGLVLGLLLLALCVQVSAKDSTTPDVARKSSSVRAGSTLSTQPSSKQALSHQALAIQSLALDLVRYGDRQKDALALIQAARMQQGLGTQVKEGSPRSEAMLLQRARSYAPSRADLILLMDDVAASASRGAQAGPVLEHFLVPVNELQRLVVRFTGGVKATFALNSDEPQKLDVEVLDSAGKAVCLRTGTTNRECSWTPTTTSDYQIRIRNVGSTTSEYSVFHN